VIKSVNETALLNMFNFILSNAVSLLRNTFPKCLMLLLSNFNMFCVDKIEKKHAIVLLLYLKVNNNNTSKNVLHFPTRPLICLIRQLYIPLLSKHK